MIAFPRHGLRMSKAGDIVTVSMTDDPDNSSFKYYAHSRGSTLKDTLYVGAYLGSTTEETVDGETVTKLRSLSGKNTIMKNISYLIEYGQANGAPNGNGGSGYDVRGYHSQLYLQAMYVLKYKNLNSQEVIGKGKSSSNLLPTGTTNNEGMNYGTNDTTKSIKLFGVEDLWGNTHEILGNILTDNDGYIITDTENFNSSGVGYRYKSTIQYGYYVGGGDQYYSKIVGTSEFGFFAMNEGLGSGSSSTYYCDSNRFWKWRTCGIMSTNPIEYNGIFGLGFYMVPNDKGSTGGGRLMYL